MRSLRELRAALSPDRLAFRLAVILSVALLPVGAIAVWQTASLMRDTEASEHAALVRNTTDAVSGQRAVIESLFVSARTLGPIAAGRRDDPEECTRIVTEFAQASPLVLFAGVMSPEGAMDCVSVGAGREFGEDIAAASGIGTVPLVSRHARGPTADMPVIVASMPFWEDGDFAGHMMLAMLESNLGLIRQSRDAPLPLAAVLLNATGQVVHVWPETVGADIWRPEDETLLRAAPGRSDRALATRNRAGERVALVTASVIPDQLHVVGVWPADMAPGAGGAGRIAASLAFPVLMWAISLAVAYVAVFRLAIRYVRHINSTMRRFALGQQDAPPMDPGGAPGEIRELMSTLNRMMRIIVQDKANLTASVREKTVLLKEVHHRVKNNFQLISSIINLQLRKVAAPDSHPGSRPDAHEVLRSVQDRVLSLAAIHRAYYEADNMAEVRADRLLGSILDQLVAGTGADGARVSAGLDPVPLAPDQIVPLSLILTESMTEALRSAPGGSLEIALKAGPGGIVRLVVTRPGAAPAPGGEADIRQQLLETLTLQLEGRIDHETISRPDGPAQRFTLAFHGAPGAPGKPD